MLWVSGTRVELKDFDKPHKHRRAFGSCNSEQSSVGNITNVIIWISPI